MQGSASNQKEVAGVKKKLEKSSDAGQTLRTFYRMIRLGMPKWLLCFLGVVLIGLGNYGFSLVTGLLLSTSLNHFKEGNLALLPAAVLLGIAFIVMWGIVAGYILNVRGAMGIRAGIQKRLLSVWIRQTEAFAARRHSSDAMTLVTSDMDIMEDFYFQGLAHVFMVPFFGGVAAFITIIGIDFRLALAPVITGLISLFFSLSRAGRIQEKNRKVRLKTDSLTKSFSEIASGNTAYRTMGMTSGVLRRYFKQSDAYAHLSAEAQNIQVNIKFVVQLMSTLSVVLFIGTGIWLADTGKMDFSLVLLAFPLQSMVGDMVCSFGDAWNFIVTAGTSGERVIASLKWPKEMEGEGKSCVSSQKEKMLKLSHIHFGYEEETPVLQDISLEIESGKKIALVGASGSGKSTILQLLLRFYEPDGGTISVGGISAKDCSLEGWRSAFVLLSQEAPMMARSVRENIAMGLYGDGKQPSDSEIEKAARAAGIHDFITALPDRYDTVVTEEGGNISGGQRQRIAIARAFLSNAPIVLLDEPTAALDAESEKLVQQSLWSLMDGRTVIMIAHRLETVQDFDEIVVLDHGEIVQRGTHEQLMKKEGPYSRLYLLQERAEGSTACSI